MAYGSFPYGSGTYGGGSPIRATFDVEQAIKGDPIIVVASLFGQELIEYFRTHPDELKVMNRRKFEELVAELFLRFGYDVELTQQTRDGGRDIIAVKKREVNVKYLIECKRPAPGNVVGVGAVRSLLGVVYNERPTMGILVTTAFFSKPAKLLFEENEWHLQGKDYDALVKWLDDYFNS